MPQNRTVPWATLCRAAPKATPGLSNSPRSIHRPLLDRVPPSMPFPSLQNEQLCRWTLVTWPWARQFSYAKYRISISLSFEHQGWYWGRLKLGASQKMIVARIHCKLLFFAKRMRNEWIIGDILLFMSWPKCRRIDRRYLPIGFKSRMSLFLSFGRTMSLVFIRET